MSFHIDPEILKKIADALGPTLGKKFMEWFSHNRSESSANAHASEILREFLTDTDGQARYEYYLDRLNALDQKTTGVHKAIEVVKRSAPRGAMGFLVGKPTLVPTKKKAKKATKRKAPSGGRSKGSLSKGKSTKRKGSKGRSSKRMSRRR